MSESEYLFTENTLRKVILKKKFKKKKGDIKEENH